MGAAGAFHKYEGLGNDFILVDAAAEDDVNPVRASELCDRRFGVGADGVILVLPARAPGCDVRMRVLNADGSIPEMCGNGVRCVALHVARGRRQQRVTVRVETDAGERACVVDDTGAGGQADGEASVTVDMGRIEVLGDRAVDVQGRPVVVTVVDAGNPHAILFGAFARGDVEHLGPRLATSAAFPRGTNVEFACVASDGIDLVVWERGVGITMACGTGACAAVAAACAKDLATRGKPVTVRLPGGALEITLSADGRATMTGPARRVFDGVLAQAPGKPRPA